MAFLHIRINNIAQGIGHKSGTNSPINQDENSNNEEIEQESVEDVTEIDYAAINEQERIKENERIEKMKEEKEIKRAEVYRKKITKQKKEKTEDAYISLQQYQKKYDQKSPREGDTTHPNDDLGHGKGPRSNDLSPLVSPLALQNSQGFDFDKIQGKDNFIAASSTAPNFARYDNSKGITSGEIMHLNSDSENSQTRKMIQVVTSKDKGMKQITKILPLPEIADQNRNFGSSLNNESADDSYNKDIIGRARPDNEENAEEYLNEYGLEEEKSKTNDRIMGETYPGSRVDSPSSVDQSMKQNYLHTGREKHDRSHVREGGRTTVNTSRAKGSKIFILYILQ